MVAELMPLLHSSTENRLALGPTLKLAADDKQGGARVVALQQLQRLRRDTTATAAMAAAAADVSMCASHVIQTWHGSRA